MATTLSYQSAVDAAVAALQTELARIGLETKRLQGMIATLKAGAVPLATKQSKSIQVPKTPKTSDPTKIVKKKRSRRSSEDVKGQAKQMADFIMSKGKAGVSGKDITAEFGKVLPSIKAFINPRVDAKSKIKTRGAASKTVYFAG